MLDYLLVWKSSPKKDSILCVFLKMDHSVSVQVSHFALVGKDKVFLVNLLLTNKFVYHPWKPI